MSGWFVDVELFEQKKGWKPVSPANIVRYIQPTNNSTYSRKREHDGDGRPKDPGHSAKRRVRR